MGTRLADPGPEVHLISLSDLAAARANGLVPKGAILIALAAPPPHAMTRVKIDGRDLRALTGLDVVVAFGSRSSSNRLVALADAIARVGPQELEFWNVESNRFVAVVSLGQKFIHEVPPREDVSWSNG